MGLLTGLLTLPLAPVRGVALIAEQLAAQAERELYGDPASLRRELSELQRAEAFGEIGEGEYLAREEALLAQLARMRSMPYGGAAATSANAGGGTGNGDAVREPAPAKIRSAQPSRTTVRSARHRRPSQVRSATSRPTFSSGRHRRR